MSTGQNTKPEDLAGNPLSLDNQLCFALYSVTNKMIRLYRPLLSRIGLTYPQYLAMLVLWEAEPQSVGELGTKLGLDSGTLTPLLKRLENMGLLERRRDPSDERRVTIRLTQKGRELRTDAAEIPGAVACQLGMAPDKLIELKASLDAMKHEMPD